MIFRTVRTRRAANSVMVVLVYVRSRSEQVTGASNAMGRHVSFAVGQCWPFERLECGVGG